MFYNLIINLYEMKIPKVGWRVAKSLDYEHLNANKRGPLRCKFDLPRVTDARNASTPRELRDNERFRNPRGLLRVAPAIISSLPIVIFLMQEQFISSLRKLIQI